MLAMVDRQVSTVDGATRHSPVAALEGALEELAGVVAALTPEAYRARLFPNASGSIGEHVRHCLDHVSALVTADPSSCLSYDRRERGTAVETDPSQALRSIQLLRLKIAVGRWSTRLDEPICVMSTMTHGGVMLAAMSTLGRELAFVLSHTIHHQALIGMLATLHGYDVPDRFGFSPSTPRQ
jgi:DinB family protein